MPWWERLAAVRERCGMTLMCPVCPQRNSTRNKGEPKSAVAGGDTFVTFAIRIRDRSGHTYYRNMNGGSCDRH